MENVASAEKAHENKGDKPDKKLVSITVDNVMREVERGHYLVSNFKELVHVPAEKDLDQIIDGVLTHLPDDASVKIKGEEVFVSHERSGGAS
jgi:hypothetical protein